MNFELSKKQEYYSGAEFVNELATLMIPDVHQYVLNIIFCFHQAHESKLIYCNIIEQLHTLRKENRTFYNSFTYKVGTLFVDGRAYANRNFRDWCANMHKISDSILQIINIVYNLENDIDKVKYSSTIKKSGDANLKELWNKYTNLLNVEFNIDNTSKHRLTVATGEKLSPLAIEKIDYYIKIIDKYVYVEDLLSDKKEDNIYAVIFELLDYIVSVARSRTYNNRFYVELDLDLEVPFVNSVELVNDINTNRTNTVVIKTVNEKQKNGTYFFKSASIETNDKPIDMLYLASIYKLRLPIGIDMNKIAGFDVEKIDVIKNGRIVGYYKLVLNKDIGVHFSKYQYVSN